MRMWKNTEDEILKVAVGKYSANEWSRIQSLLPDKTAKQCKARWNEWVSSSIKKTTWTGKEDEKLLHMAKLLPNQWRTIAPIVGRTSAQCMERYEKLLDMACEKDGAYEPSHEPCKLRAGEIDSNPESRPARPDPVDMDEDEIQMLTEARARLANTRGKKAKRKAREKLVEEARKLAALQKRRELKAAGIGAGLRKRKFDYNLEIPFEKRPPPGFFDVSQEDGPAELPMLPTTVEELEGKQRIDIEAQLHKQDIAKNKIALREDAPSTINRVNKLNTQVVHKRMKLTLPTPQVSDRELEEIAKLSSPEVDKARRSLLHLSSLSPSCKEPVEDRERDEATKLVTNEDFNQQETEEMTMEESNVPNQVDKWFGEFDMAKKELETRAKNIERKLEVITGGYKTRAESLWRELELKLEKADKLSTELQCYKALREQELVAIPNRIETLQDAVRKQSDKERILQKRYECALLDLQELSTH